ncbi:MAG: MBL fold metallo-hydrolase [Tannerella sp.]|jgi:L-ascorbate metabolism protein UlaG (beta-lactamase superfamily)|nr:MBL fold metallo-hydrolase [Tannerella sp.]
MKLTYIYHSGYAIEGERCTIVTDYYKDSHDGYVRRSLASFPGKLYVLSSHWHPDHFNKTVLEWKNIRPDTQYIFSEDVFKNRHIPQKEASSLNKGDTWQDENIRIKAFGSTDVGISFLIEAEGKKIFHAGDLNNWHWDEESTPEEVRTAERDFLKEVDDLRKETDRVDLAMFPVDSRLGKNYMRGAEQFVDRIHAGIFAPMHFGERYEEAHAFKPYAEKAGCRFAAWTKTGENLFF